ncbi:hypothetical protein [Microbacterium sp. Leaf151]|uniref:hypothetical protein n=1 Tax=Microbacterium sp. Leaf151 TaxID=1736276 RepID=UPI000A81455E|nr:hypothetical protein [Microbacterium sp. Leaf151]
MNLQDVLDPGKAPITAALYERLEAQRSEIRQLRTDAREQLGEDLDAYRRAVLLEAEVDAMWHVLDAVLEAVHAVETGEGFSAVLVETD